MINEDHVKVILRFESEARIEITDPTTWNCLDVSCTGISCKRCPLDNIYAFIESDTWKHIQEMYPENFV